MGRNEEGIRVSIVILSGELNTAFFEIYCEKWKTPTYIYD